MLRAAFVEKANYLRPRQKSPDKFKILATDKWFSNLLDTDHTDHNKQCLDATIGQ